MTLRQTLWIALVLAALPFCFDATLGCGFQQGSLPPETMEPLDANALHCDCTCGADGTAAPPVVTGSDDAEENSGSMNTTEASLDFGTRIVGVRFNRAMLPAHADIQSAVVEFNADTSDSSALDLTISGEQSTAALTFTLSSNDLSNRIVDHNHDVSWSPVPAWANGTKQQTPELKDLIQSLVDQPGWSSASAVVLRIEVSNGTTGHRSARSFNGAASSAPKLIVSYGAAVDATLPVCAPLSPPLLVEHVIPVDGTRGQTEQCSQVATTLQGLTGACGYPSDCSCTPTAAPAGHDNSFESDVCSDSCTPMAVADMCSNFDPNAFAECIETAGNTLDDCKPYLSATNAGSDTAVCVTSGSALAFHAFGRRSLCELEGTSSIRVGDREPQHDPATKGRVEILGGPCPAGGCNVTPYVDLVMDPITFSVKFHSDPTFDHLSATGRGLATALVSSGEADFAHDTVAGTGNGQRSTDKRSVSATNALPLNLGLDWVGKKCDLTGNLAGDVDGETPEGHCTGDASVACAVDSPDCDQAGGPCVFPQDTQAMAIDVNLLDGDLVNQPPTAVAGAEQTVECTSSAGASFSLDGRGSSDPDDNLALASWRQGSRTGPLVSSGFTAATGLGVGTSQTYVLRVIDVFAQTDEAATEVAVVDTTPPELSLSVTPTQVWPANHKLFEVTATLETSDTCDPSPQIRLVSVTSNEPDEGLGDGDAPQDVQGAAFGSDDRSFLLRSERSGKGSGRAYTISYESRDASGNATLREATVSVAQSQGGP